MSLIWSLAYTLGILLGIIFLFVLALILGSLIPVNRKFKAVKNGIDIYVTSNGMHLDFIVPVDNQFMDWSKFIDGQPYSKPISDYTYLGIGWGAPEFYFELETWDHVPLELAFRAFAIPSSTVMHVIGYDDLPYEDLKIKKISISTEQYISLCHYVRDGFKLDFENNLNLIRGAGYTADDNFYHANGSYHIFHTCNYWINKGLKKIGVYAPLWSPLEKGVIYQLNKLKMPLNEPTNSSFEISLEGPKVI